MYPTAAQYFCNVATLSTTVFTKSVETSFTEIWINEL